ncbi:hypothetical protein Hanom_Chr17g01537631 [Helianthus anomalus]
MQTGISWVYTFPILILIGYFSYAYRTSCDYIVCLLCIFIITWHKPNKTLGTESFQEEHYISKLHFTWPQVSCLTGYSPRGSKVVFMSYKDQAGQARHSNLFILFIFTYWIQKFAVRFITTDETERFINFLKVQLILSLHVVVGAQVPIQDSSAIASSADTYIQPYYPVENHDGSLNSNHLSQDVQGKLSAFPPSFTSLLMNCYPVAELGAFISPSFILCKRGQCLRKMFIDNDLYLSFVEKVTILILLH